MIDTREIRHGHLFAGLGGGAKGFNQGVARVGSLQAKFRCIGGIDVDAAAIRDFERLAGVRGTILDLFTREQYKAFHEREPPADWCEATPADVHAAFGHERPHIVFLSAPCKGFSGLLSESRSLSAKYQALNQLALRGVLLTLEAYKDDPIEFYLFENVPRIQTRGRPLLDQIEGLLRAYGYAVAETTHDCGELGNLAQSRKRFLLVARHVDKVPPFLYEPVKRPLRAVGDVLGRMLLPGDPAAGPMHRVPALHWRTWVRLAFVEAGSDWRSLQKLRVADGFLQDFGLVPEMAYRTVYGVNRWEDQAPTITTNSRCGAGAFSVADPRIDGHEKSVQMGVRGWDQPAPVVTGKMFAGGGPNSVADPRFGAEWPSNQYGVTPYDEPAATVTSQRSPGQGRFAVADPRMPRPDHFRNVYRIVRWGEVSPAVTAGGHPSAGGVGVADPRYPWRDAHESKMRVTDWDEPSRTVTGSDRVGSGALSVADPRPQQGWQGGKYRVTGFDEAAGTVIAESGTGNGAFSVADPRTQQNVYSGYGVTEWNKAARTIAGESFPSNGCFAVADPRHPGLERSLAEHYQTAGHYGVVPWNQPAYSVTGRQSHDRGFGSVADPRLPEPTDRLVAVIRALDGTWHRPFTTLDLAALQSLIDPEEKLELDGLSDAAWRERIGNAVPSSAAAAIAGVIGTTLLLAWAGETFVLGSTPIWVRDVAVALSVAQPRGWPQ